LDHQKLLKLVMASLFKIIDYDICGTLLYDAQNVYILIQPSYAQSVRFIDHIKEGLLREVSAFCNEDLSKKRMNVVVLPVDPAVQPEATRPFGELKSSFNAPLLIKGKITGVISLSSAQGNVFSEDEAKFINTVANQASNAIEHLQAMASAEKSKMESMVEGMLEGVILLDENEEMVALNPRAKEMIGFGPEETVSSAMLHEKIRLVNLDAALAECSRENEIIMREIVMPDSKWQTLNCVISPVKSDKKKVGTAVILRDITREKEVDAMKTEFISTVSHELRTPLSITKEGLSLILDKVAGDITEKQEMILTTAKDNIDRLGRLINNVLDISKIEAGKMEVRKERLNIVQLAGHVASTFAMKVKEKNLELHVRFPENVLEVFADRDKMIQVFTNLINNAIKFTPSGHIELSGKIVGDHVECAVTDTGIGISPENLARTFVKFQQFDRVSGSGEKGTGLGLSIAKGIVEMHSGKIWVESELDKGAKFIFTLPIYTPELPLAEFVGDGIKAAKRSNARMSLITIAMSEEKGFQERFSKGRQEDYLENIKNVLRKDLHRDGDAVFCASEKCFVTLMNCSKSHIDNICDRLRGTLSDYLDSEQLTGAAILKTAYATYPDDASDSDGLLKKVNHG
jgi:PAS domain S-box-containing protein